MDGFFLSFFIRLPVVGSDRREFESRGGLHEVSHVDLTRHSLSTLCAFIRVKAQGDSFAITTSSHGGLTLCQLVEAAAQR